MRWNELINVTASSQSRNLFLSRATMFLKEVFGLEKFDARFPKITLDNLDVYVKEVLEDASQHQSQDAGGTNMGRLGPEKVVFQDGTLLKRPDQLEVTSHNHFGSAKGNVCVYKGKWMYEVMLNSNGVMQLGWCTLNCTFSREEGVGDTAYSYAYDGARRRKWNNKIQHKYGDLWMSGDVISCCMDCDEGSVSFYRNGHAMGVAYDKVRLGPMYAYFPAVSLSMCETVLANFGSTPFRYPVEGYEPLEKAPTENLQKAHLLTKFLYSFIERTSCDSAKTETPESAEIEVRLSSQSTNQSKKGATSSPVRSQVISHDAKLLLSANAIFDNLGPLLKNDYVVTECLLKLFMDLTDVSNWNKPQLKVQRVLCHMWSLLQEHEIKTCLDSLVVSLQVCYRFAPVKIGHPEQRHHLITLLAMLQHPRTRIHLLKNVLFSSLKCFNSVKFWHFIHFKAPDDNVIEQILHTVWWKDKFKDDADNKKAKDELESCCTKVRQQSVEIENIQTEILKILLTKNDGQKGASSRFIFMMRFREYLRDVSTCRSLYPHLVNHYPLGVSLCVFQRMLAVVRAELEHGAHQDGDCGAQAAAQDETCVPVKMFYDDSVNYHDIQRVGGLMSHLKKEYKQDLHEMQCKGLGVDPQLPKHRVLIDHKNKMAEAQTQTIADQLGNNEERRTYLEILDGLLWLYSTSACKQALKMSLLKDAVQQYHIALDEVNKKITACPLELPHVRETLENSKKVLADVMEKQARQLNWIRCALFTDDKRDNIGWLLVVVLDTVEQASESGKFFSFVPEYYVTVVVSFFAAMKSHFLGEIEEPHAAGYDKAMKRLALFLTNHYADKRVVNSDLKDALTHALIAFVCEKDSLVAVESMSECNKTGFVQTLLTPNRDGLWSQSNWILVRFWMGCGFGFRESKSSQSPAAKDVEPLHEPALPSAVYQQHIAEYMHHNVEDAVKFVDSLLTQLNWCFSEFIGILQELHTTITRSAAGVIDSRQLKLCSACFEIAVALTRVLEMLTSLVPEVFADFSRSSAELLLCRLCQSVCQILNRVTSKSGSFYKVIGMLVPGLELVGHLPIVTACAGVLVNLCVKTEGRSQERAVAAFLADSNFQPTFLDFMLQEPHVTEDGATAGARVSETARRARLPLKSYREKISMEELHTIETLIESFKSKYKTMHSVELDEESVCNICYAKPKSVSFNPCGHQSCRACIAHQMMGTKECFFCKTTVQLVEELKDGTPL